MGSGRGAGAARQRVLQAGFVAAALLAVLVADRTADSLLLADGGSSAPRLAAALVLGGRMTGGWALGMALRLQFVRAAGPDRQARLLLGLPLGGLAAWPVCATLLPAELSTRLPAWLVAGPLLDLGPFAAVAFGLVLSLGVTGRRGR